MNTDAIESMVRDVLSRMNSLQGDTSAPATGSSSTTQTAKVTDYPLASKHPEWVKTATNKTLDEFTLENVLQQSDRAGYAYHTGNAAHSGGYRQRCRT